MNFLKLIEKRVKKSVPRVELVPTREIPFGILVSSSISFTYAVGFHCGLELSVTLKLPLFRLGFSHFLLTVDH